MAKSFDKQLGIYKQLHQVSVEVITMGMSGGGGSSSQSEEHPLTEESEDRSVC